MTTSQKLIWEERCWKANHELEGLKHAHERVLITLEEMKNGGDDAEAKEFLKFLGDDFPRYQYLQPAIKRFQQIVSKICTGELELDEVRKELEASHVKTIEELDDSFHS